MAGVVAGRHSVHTAAGARRASHHHTTEHSRNTTSNIVSFLSELNADDEGASMVEYGLLVAFIAFIAVIALVGVTALGINVNSLFGGISF